MYEWSGLCSCCFGVNFFDFVTDRLILLRVATYHVRIVEDLVGQQIYL